MNEFELERLLAAREQAADLAVYFRDRMLSVHDGALIYRILWPTLQGRWTHVRIPVESIEDVELRGLLGSGAMVPVEDGMEVGSLFIQADRRDLHVAVRVADGEPALPLFVLRSVRKRLAYTPARAKTAPLEIRWSPSIVRRAAICTSPRNEQH